MAKHPILTYHQATFDLIEHHPEYDLAAMQLLDQVHQNGDIALPASVREWYSLQGATDILRTYSNEDHPLTLAEIVHKVRMRRNIDYEDPLESNMIPFLWENQGVFQCFIKLDGSDDPPVMVWDDDKIWKVWSDHFSEFVCGWVWNFLYWTRHCVLRADEGLLTDTDVQSLQARFGQAGHVLVDSPIYHFYNNDQHIHIWRRNADHTSWWLRAATKESLLELTRSVWHIGTLAESLQIQWGYIHGCAGKVLEVLRYGTELPEHPNMVGVGDRERDDE